LKLSIRFQEIFMPDKEEPKQPSKPAPLPPKTGRDHRSITDSVPGRVRHDSGTSNPPPVNEKFKKVDE
jgi:hypothetical protein